MVTLTLRTHASALQKIPIPYMMYHFTPRKSVFGVSYHEWEMWDPCILNPV